jgi:hypothetical protein
MKPLGRQRDNVALLKPRGIVPHIIPREHLMVEEKLVGVAGFEPATPSSRTG